MVARRAAGHHGLRPQEIKVQYLKRVFRIDNETYQACDGQARIIVYIEDQSG